MAYFFYCLECMFKQNKNKNVKKKNVQEMSWITKKQPDMSQNKLWKEKKLILPWIKWIKKKSKHSNKYIFEIGLHLFD